MLKKYTFNKAISFINLSLGIMIGSLSYSPVALAAPQEAYIKPRVTIQYWLTTNHVPVYFIPIKELPIVDVALAINAGSARAEQKTGLAYLTMKMLLEPSSTEQQKLTLADIGAVLHHTLDRDKVVLHLRSTSKPEEFKAAFRLLTVRLTVPNFTQARLQHQQQQILSTLRKQQDTAKYKGKAALLRMIYQQHPYAYPILGTAKSMQALSLRDVQDFYRRYYTAGNLTIALVGCLDRQQAIAIAEKISHAMLAGPAASDLPSALATLPATTIQHIAHPSSQSHLFIGQIGIAPKDNDFFPLLIGNQILGGGALLSRLGNEIRVKRGLAYKVLSHFMPWQAKGPFIINVQTHHSHINIALQLVQKVLIDFVRQGPSLAELKAAKQRLIGSFPIHTNSNEEIVQQLIHIGFYRLPLDYFKTYQDKIAAVTLAQVNAALQRHINPERLAITITGGDS